MFPFFNRCKQCENLEASHDHNTEEYLTIIDRQTALFKGGEIRRAKDLDASVRSAKRVRESALNALVRHQETHRPQRSLLRFG